MDSGLRKQLDTLSMEDSDRLGSRQKEAEEGSPERLKAWGEASDSAAQPLERWGRRPGGQDRVKSKAAQRPRGKEVSDGGEQTLCLWGMVHLLHTGVKHSYA